MSIQTESPPADCDLLVIGGGTAGMTAAKQVARAGKRVTLVEAERTGGDCLTTGCVPSKSLIATARALQQIRRAGDHGIEVGEPRLDLPRAMARKERIIEQIGEADSPAALAEAGVTTIAGVARFSDPRTITVDGRPMRAERFVIATGSRPTLPPIPGLAEAGVVTNVALMETHQVPARLVVIGAGPTGIELGQTFARFGSVVTIVEHGERILGRDDREIATFLQRRLAGEGIVFHLGATVERLERDGDERRVVVRTANGDVLTLGADTILVAVGRTPTVDDLGLDRADVVSGERGITVDRRLRTTAAHIWACGDVIGPPYLTHAAEDQARTVAKNVLGGRSRWDGRAIPWATFTEPEVAGVGLTEEAARVAHGDRLEVLRLPYRAVDRAVTDGEEAGLIKILLAPGWTRGHLGGEIVGAHVVGERSAELVQQLAFMLAWRLPAGLHAKTVQAYPTYGLGARQALGLHWRRTAETRASPSPLGRLLAKLG